MSVEYKSIKKRTTVELSEKKSRFIADAGIVHNEDDAKAFIDDIKKRYREASHHTYAYVIGENVPAARYSDDGEPHGTAGLPILGVVQGNGLTNIIIVVTRYFGGTKLGTGGLVRAYSKSASDCLALAGIMRHIPGYIMKISTDYHNLGKIKNYLEKHRYHIIDEEYASHVIIMALVPIGDSEELITKLTDLTNATADIKKAGERYIETEG